MTSRKHHYPALAGINIADWSPDQLKALVRQLLEQKIHGISFSPYVEGQGPGTPISEAQIRERLAIIRPYVNWVRTFSCSKGNELIPPIAREFGLKTMVGAWLDGDRENNEAELNGAIAVAQAGFADLLAVGNEVLLREELPESELIELINRAKAGAPGVPVGYVDAYYLFENHPRVSEACDVIFANCYPFWEGYPAEHALVYMKDMYRRAVRAGRGRPVIISETGWPDAGSMTRGVALPSFENAIRYFINTFQWAGEEEIGVFWFSSFDEAWKVADEGDVGAYWGLWDKDGKLKYD